MSVGALYSPASSVVRVRATPLSLSMIVTVAPDMTPPVWSVTAPRRRPKVPWENSDMENSSTPRTVDNKNAILFLRPQKDVRNPDVLGLIVSPLQEFLDR